MTLTKNSFVTHKVLNDVQLAVQETVQYMPTDIYFDDLDFTIELELDDLSDELDNILCYDLRTKLYQIKQDCFLEFRDYTIYHENNKYLQELPILSTVKIGNIEFLKVLGEYHDGDPCDMFVNLTTGDSSLHFSRLSPMDYLLSEHNTQKIISTKKTLRSVIEQVFYFHLYSLKLILEFIGDKFNEIYQTLGFRNK